MIAAASHHSGGQNYTAFNGILDRAEKGEPLADEIRFSHLVI